MTPQQYCLRWKHHHSNVQSMFAQLLQKERFCDVTLYCSPNFATHLPDKDPIQAQNIRGVSLRAHRVVLAACSELLATLLGAHEAHGEPVLVIDGAEPRHLKALLDYMYTGEMNVHHSQLAGLLKTAEELRIKGLTDIRWNNKDEPPDCDTEQVTAMATTEKKPDIVSSEKQPETQDSKHTEAKPPPETKQTSPKQSPKRSPKHQLPEYIDVKNVKPDIDLGETMVQEKFNVNGGPPPLIKIPIKEKSTPPKRELSNSDPPSPKRQRLTSGTENTDEDSVSHSIPEKDSEWQHGNLDITAERVVGWGGDAWSRDPSDDEWADAPADIGSFLHTRLRVDGDNSADEESNDSAGGAASVVSAAASSSTSTADRSEIAKMEGPSQPSKFDTAMSSKAGQDPRFPDVVKLTDYLQHGRRPQFWEEHYVKRVMEAVRMKELEMKQAAEILGVSYGTLYGRYRDVYGCINRPYRTARDFWQAKGPSEVLDRLQRGDISVEAASLALGVGVSNLAAYMSTEFSGEKEFDPIPIEVDPSLKVRRSFSGGPNATTTSPKTTVTRKPSPAVDKPQPKKIMIGSLMDEDPIPATVVAAGDTAATAATAATAGSGKWPTIRVASLETLRSEPASPTALMRTRPDLTIVAAKRDKRDDA